MSAAPRLSIVVPAHRVEAYLPACLDSVLGETYDDDELIAVDDASPDACGAIIDDAAGRDGRVRAVHLPENVGLGAARNAGIDAARGDYVLFLDGDDLLAFGALGAIAFRLAETGEPDLLVFDYVHLGDSGEQRPHTRAGVLGSVGSDVVSVDEAPQLLDLLEVAWAKAYRREFLLGAGLRFPPGYYEDIPVHFPALLSARRVAVLDRVCVRYRERGGANARERASEDAETTGTGTREREEGSILGGRSGRHRELLDQYDRVFAFLDAHPELDRWRAAVFGRMMGHCWWVLARAGRLPAADRRAFFDRLAGEYRARRPAGYRPRQLRARFRGLLTERRAYRGFTASAAGWRAVTDAVPALRRAAEPARRAALLGYYAAQRLRPVDDHLAVYAAYRHRFYAGNPAAIYEQARTLAPHIHGVWAVRRSGLATVPPGVDAVPLGSRGHLRAMARARYYVHDTLLSRGSKRRGTVWVQTQHGTPFKNMGLDLRGHPDAAGTDIDRQVRRTRRWDAVVSANPHSSQVWRRAYPTGYELLETGYPRNDRLATATGGDVARARAMVGVGDRTAVLYAPTFRGGPAGGGDPGPDPAAVAAAVGEALGDGAVLLVRAHYRADQPWELAAGQRGARIVDVSGYHPIEDLYLAADLLVTDYSSAMVDYAVLDRPIVLYLPDWDAYRADRGLSVDLLAEPPGAVARTPAELAEVFRSGRVCGEQAARDRAAFRARFCPWDDGHAAERVVRRVFDAAPDDR